MKVQKELIRRELREAPESVRQLLETDEPVYSFACRKFVDDESFYEEIFIPAFVFPDIEGVDIVAKSLYDLIEEKGTKKIFRVIQAMEATELQREAAGVLNMKEGSPALLISRTLVSSDGIPVAYTRVAGYGRKHKFQMEFEKIK